MLRWVVTLGSAPRLAAVAGSACSLARSRGRGWRACTGLGPVARPLDRSALAGRYPPPRRDRARRALARPRMGLGLAPPVFRRGPGTSHFESGCPLLPPPASGREPGAGGWLAFPGSDPLRGPTALSFSACGRRGDRPRLATLAGRQGRSRAARSPGFPPVGGPRPLRGSRGSLSGAPSRVRGSGALRPPARHLLQTRRQRRTCRRQG